MKSTLLLALLALNVVLLISFVSRFVGNNTAMAQVTRRPGEYAMIPGLITGGSSGVVYVIDTTNGLLTAVTLDQSTGAQGHLASLPQINLADLFARGSGVAPQNPGNGNNGNRNNRNGR